MNIKHAQYMLTVLQEGNITNAAKKLYISQPSLSQMIKLVENNLGTPIFNRSTDPITLTYPAGNAGSSLCASQIFCKISSCGH